MFVGSYLTAEELERGASMQRHNVGQEESLKTHDVKQIETRLVLPVLLR